MHPPVLPACQGPDGRAQPPQPPPQPPHASVWLVAPPDQSNCSPNCSQGNAWGRGRSPGAGLARTPRAADDRAAANPILLSRRRLAARTAMPHITIIISTTTSTTDTGAPASRRARPPPPPTTQMSPTPTLACNLVDALHVDVRRPLEVEQQRRLAPEAGRHHRRALQLLQLLRERGRHGGGLWRRRRRGAAGTGPTVRLRPAHRMVIMILMVPGPNAC